MDGKVNQRMHISKDNIDKLDKWHLQVMNALPSAKLKKSDLLNWLLEQLSIDLSSTQLSEIGKRFFDPLLALKVTAKKVREAKDSGQYVNFQDLIHESLMRSQTHKKKS